jgi:hypothetical protein
MKKASLHGLTFRNDVEIDGNYLNSQIGDSYREFMGGFYRWISFRYYRPIGEPPVEREDGTHGNVNVSIDESVFAGWINVPEYRPRNLADWAERKKVDIGSLESSVLADNPYTAAPD